ncbi:UNVERIFIED_CONTAM: hypothetical protein HDU68_011174 [Siphonaria sp. JEL0065]|nr:hypothetical protein HDU68_011174 [Siphonaria sp. JEL0065]
MSEASATAFSTPDDTTNVTLPTVEKKPTHPLPPVVRRSRSLNGITTTNSSNPQRFIIPFIPLNKIVQNQDFPSQPPPRMIELRRAESGESIRNSRKRLESAMKRVSVTLNSVHEEEGEGSPVSPLK